MAVSDTDIIIYKSLGVSGDGAPSCGGAIDTNSPLTEALNELFDSISASEANGSNKDEYRLVYIKNTHASDKLFLASLSIASDSSSPSTSISICLDAAGHNSASTITLTDEEDSDNKLSGLTFGVSSLDIGDEVDNTLSAGEFMPVWIKRSLVTPATSTPNDTATLLISGEVV